MFGNGLFVSFQNISVLSTDKVPFHTELFMYVELKQKLLVGLFPARQQGEIGISEKEDICTNAKRGKVKLLASLLTG